MTDQNSLKTPFYFSTPFIIATLIFCFPVGLIAMWAGNRFSMGARVGISIAWGVIFLSSVASPKKAAAPVASSASSTALAPAEGSPSSTPTPAPPAAPAPAMPASQQQFCDAINKGRSSYRTLQEGDVNELMLSKLRSNRKAEVAAAVKGGVVKDWIGEVDSLSTNSEGKAIFIVTLPCDAKIGTWNNAVSDMMDNTLIPQSSPLFDGIAALKPGMALRVSGKLAAGDVDGFRESSMTELGSMTDPFFVIRFSGIGPP